VGSPRRRGIHLRPRFLALREFGPNNIVYHEGRSGRSSVSNRRPAALKNAGTKGDSATHAEVFAKTSLDCCPDCGTRFDPTNSELLHLLDQPNVRCRRRERITCDEEDRRRRGFDVRLAYQFGREPGGMPRTRVADVMIGQSPALRLTYGPASTLIR